MFVEHQALNAKTAADKAVASAQQSESPKKQ